MAAGSVDRLEEIPERLAFLFDYDAAAALQRPGVAAIVNEPGARDVIAALPQAITGPMLDRDSFRAMATRVREMTTGHKGKALFHPIRAALTGEEGGPELDLAVPAIDRGAALGRMPPSPNNRGQRRAGAGVRGRRSAVDGRRHQRAHLRHQHRARSAARRPRSARADRRRAGTRASTRSWRWRGRTTWSVERCRPEALDRAVARRRPPGRRRGRRRAARLFDCRARAVDR